MRLSAVIPHRCILHSKWMILLVLTCIYVGFRNTTIPGPSAIKHLQATHKLYPWYDFRRYYGLVHEAEVKEKNVHSSVSEQKKLNGGMRVPVSNKQLHNAVVKAGGPRSVKMVLIVTYARSGSSWLGDITTKTKDSFYIFEPFREIMHESYFRHDMICFNNATCRPPHKMTESHKFAISQLSKLLTCQFQSVSKHIQNTQADVLKSGKIPPCGRYKHRYAQCLRYMAIRCRKANIRVVKTTRISMELAKQMMNTFPTLKIIHLVRDPRAIHNSRVANKHTYTMSQQTDTHSRDICDRMYTDQQVSSEVLQEFPARLTTLFYEDLAEQPTSGSEYVYKFLHLNLTPGVKVWVYQSSHAGSRQNGYFGTMRKNSTRSANNWRQQLGFSSVQIIDKNCGNVFLLLGYLPFSSVNDLRNETLPIRTQRKLAG